MIRVRPTRSEDAEGIVTVQRRAFRDSPDMKLWQIHEIEEHVRLYPEGQFVALDDQKDDRVVGSCTSMRVTPDIALRPHTWREVTGGSMLANHTAEGSVLYGVDVSVQPSYRKSGVGRKLYAARIDLLKRSDCDGFAAGGRLPNYHHFAPYMPVETYVELVQKRLIRDPVLSFQLGNEMIVRCVMPNYLTDANSLNYATLIWLPNPSRFPPEPAGSAEASPA